MLSERLSYYSSLADQKLAELLQESGNAPILAESMGYSVFSGGKRIRPALCMAACELTGGKPEDALYAACAVELIHTYSLIHDDLPAMDNDDLRRGRPTNHKVFGEAVAILAGDAMVTIAFELLARDARPALVAALVRELAQSSGPEGMIGGQVLDIDGENQNLALPQLQRLHRMKTGALLKASCRMGAIAAGCTEKQLAAVSDYGRHLGLAFQIVDDVLDVTATAEQMGKATGKDAAKGKNTYPSLLGLDASRAQAATELTASLESLIPLGAAAEGLRAMACFVVERNT